MSSRLTRAAVATVLTAAAVGATVAPGSASAAGCTQKEYLGRYGYHIASCSSGPGIEYRSVAWCTTSDASLQAVTYGPWRTEGGAYASGSFCYDNAFQYYRGGGFIEWR